MTYRPSKIISGGQTGADTGAVQPYHIGQEYGGV